VCLVVRWVLARPGLSRPYGTLGRLYAALRTIGPAAARRPDAFALGMWPITTGARRIRRGAGFAAFFVVARRLAGLVVRD